MPAEFCIFREIIREKEINILRRRIMKMFKNSKVIITLMIAALLFAFGVANVFIDK